MLPFPFTRSLKPRPNWRRRNRRLAVVSVDTARKLAVFGDCNRRNRRLLSFSVATVEWKISVELDRLPAKN